MAIQYEAPFKDGREGAGFQDAVIYLSCIDDLTRNKGQIGAFVSSDQELHENTIEDVTAKAGLQLKVYKSLEGVQQVLLSHLAENLKQWWSDDRQRAKLAMERMHPQIQQFVTLNFQISDWDLIWFDATPLSVSAVEVADITNVQVPAPWDRQAANRFKISAEIRIRIRVNVKRLGYSMVSPPKYFKVGEEARSLDSNPFLQAASGPEAEERVTERTISLEASADGEYQSIQLLSMNLRQG